MWLPSISSAATAVLTLSAVALGSPQGGQQVSSSTASTATTVSVVSSSSSSSGSTPTAACNNSPDLCNRKYNNITHMGAHDSSFLRDASTGNSVSGNQFFNATVALGAGIRLLSAQVHNSNGALQLCHTTCGLLDAGTLEAWLTRIKFWMDNNPNEVVTLLLVNSDNFAAADYGTVFAASGIDKYGFTPTSSSSSSTSSSSSASSVNWPTLQDMISSDKRLVTFVASITESSTYPYLLNEFDYVFENAFDTVGLTNFSCTLDRPSGVSSATAAVSAGMMPLMNHFAEKDLGNGILIPNVDEIDTTNGASTTTTGALGLLSDTCTTAWGGQKPVFILVDFYDRGPAIDTADRLNGITATGRSASTSSSSSSGASALGAWGRREPVARVGMGALVAFLVVALFAV